MSAQEAVTRWSGWELRSKDADPTTADEAFGPRADGEDRYEFLAVAARGFRPPRYVTVQVQEALDEVREAEARPLRRAWSVDYRQIAETSRRKVLPFGIYLLGVNPPEAASDGEIETFNAFYTDVHLPEVAERRHALRAVRFELVRELQPPHLGAPKYLAAYEVDEAGASNRRHTGPPYSAGPDVWQRHKTPWRLWYRFLT